MNWQRLLVVFYVLVLVDGAIRKWVLPDQGALLYFAKDAVLIASFTSYALRHRAEWPPAVRGTFVAAATAAYAVAVVLQMFNLRSPSLAVSLLGVKSHLLYLVLLVLVPAAFASTDDTLKWLRRYAVWLAVPISLLGMYQYTQPPTSWVNQYLSDAPIENIATAGSIGAARITGTFSYITGMSTFAAANLALGLGLTLAGLQSGGRTLRTGLALLSLSLVVAPMTGSRAAILLPLASLPFVFIAVAGHGLVNRRLAAVAIAAGMFVVIGIPSLLGAGWSTLSERTQDAGDASERVDDTLYGPLEKLDAAGFLGYGVGATHQAAPQLVPDEVAYSWLPDLYFEEENGRIALEIGLLGFVAYLAMKLAFCAIAFVAMRRARTDAELAWCTAGFVFLLVHLVAGVVFNPTAGAFYWGFAGAVIAVWSSQRTSPDRWPPGRGGGLQASA